MTATIIDEMGFRLKWLEGPVLMQYKAQLAWTKGSRGQTTPMPPAQNFNVSTRCTSRLVASYCPRATFACVAIHALAPEHAWGEGTRPWVKDSILENLRATAGPTPHRLSMLRDQSQWRHTSLPDVPRLLGDQVIRSTVDRYRGNYGCGRSDTSEGVHGVRLSIGKTSD